LLAVYRRGASTNPPSFLQFRRSAVLLFGTGGIAEVLFVPWAGMVLGIERDGYTHS
jgi:hypothetical protein